MLGIVAEFATHKLPTNLKMRSPGNCYKRLTSNNFDQIFRQDESPFFPFFYTPGLINEITTKLAWWLEAKRIMAFLCVWSGK